MTLDFDPQLFVSTFGLVFVAEFPDKTALATLIMATRKHPVAVFLGVAGAFTVQSLIAVLFGSVMGLLPESVVRLGAGLLFFVYAALMWFRREHEEEELELKGSKRAHFWKTAGSAFVVIFIAEWGDMTQLATATLVAKFGKPVTIFLSATLALWATTAVVILIGNRVKKFVDPSLLQRVAAVIFALVGAILLAEAIWR